MKRRYIALALACLLLLGLLAACAAKGADTAASAPAADMAVTEPEVAEDAWEEETGWADAPAEYAPEAPAEAPVEEMPADDAASDPSGDGAALTPADLSEKIIYSADLSLETTDFDAATAGLERLTAEFGGFVESSQVSGYTSYESDGTARVVDRSADYVLRVPAAQFRACLQKAGTMGNVVSSGTNAQNITSQFIDQEARQHSLEVQEERLLAMLEETMDVDSLVALESRLSDVRYEIESIERTLRNWQTQVDYSTIRVYVQEVAVYTPSVPVQRSFGEQLSDAVRSGWTGFVRAMKGLLVDILESLPVLVILAVVAVVAVVLVRRRIRRRRAAPKPPAEKPAETPPKDET